MDLYAILILIIVGLLAGMLAKLIFPGRQGGGFLLTTILGILGALLGGFIAGLTGIGAAFGAIPSGVKEWAVSIATATVGALIIIFIYTMLFRRRR